MTVNLQMMTFRDYMIKEQKTKLSCPSCGGYGYVANGGDEPGYDACYRCGKKGWVNSEGGSNV